MWGFPFLSIHALFTASLSICFSFFFQVWWILLHLHERVRETELERGMCVCYTRPYWVAEKGEASSISLCIVQYDICQLTASLSRKPCLFSHFAHIILCSLVLRIRVLLILYSSRKFREKCPPHSHSSAPYHTTLSRISCPLSCLHSSPLFSSW